MTWTTTDKILLSGLLPTEASRERLRRLLNERGSEVDWPAAVRRAGQHGIAALLRFNLARGGWLDLVSSSERAMLDEMSQNSVARQLAFAHQAAQLIAALAARGITALPLKGSALMLGGYYPQAGWRAASDMDVLVEPAQMAQAQEVALACGYAEGGPERSAPIRQRLAREGHHAPSRLGPGGLALELHHRAFHYAERDFGFAEMNARAAPQMTTVSATLRLPAAEDLCLHLVHHTLVDLQSAQLMLRTLADLHFIFACEPGTGAKLEQRAAEFGLASAVKLARESLRLVAEGTVEDLNHASRQAGVTLLLDTALLESPAALAGTERLFKYFNFRRHPLQKFANLCALVFTSKPHLAQLYGAPATNRVYLNYWRRPFDLLHKINWKWLAPANVWRLMKLRKITRYSGQ